MMLIHLLVYACLLTALAYVGVRRASGMLVDTTTSIASFSSGTVRFHSRPRFHGSYVFLVTFLVSAGTYLSLQLLCNIYLRQHTIAVLENLESVNTDSEQISLLYTKIQNVANGSLSESFVSEELLPVVNDYKKHQDYYSLWTIILTLISLVLTGSYALLKISPQFRARYVVENIIKGALAFSAFLAVITTLGIVASLLFESIRFFRQVSPLDFYFGTHWSPQLAIRADQVASAGAFGAIPVFTGTLLIAGIAMSVAIPVGLMSAVYLSEYASTRVRNILKPLLEILAGIPTVVYGFFAALTVAPFISELGGTIGLDVSSESALAAGLVMGVMIVPFVCSLSDDIIHAVPNRLRYASYGLGATRSETIKRVVLPAALPGIAGAILLAISRAIGETMIVVMAAGLAAQLTVNPFENVTTVTVQIVTTLVGDQEFDSMKTLSAFALGLSLFVVTLFFNILSLYLVKRYREVYE